MLDTGCWMLEVLAAIIHDRASPARQWQMTAFADRQLQLID